MVNEKTIEKIKRIGDMLEKRGLKRLPSYSNCPYACRFTLPSRCRETYVGTFLNQFSLLRGGENGKGVMLWSDEIACERPEVIVRPVYRHNGADEDVSVEIAFASIHTSIRPFREKYEHVSEEYRNVVRRESPVDYITAKTPLFLGGSHVETRIAKLKNTAGDRAVSNALDKAEALCEAFEPADHSEYEERREDWHRDTTEEYGKRLAEAKPGA